jgi:asparagine synthase (glutamine-hydrolysing)
VSGLCGWLGDALQETLDRMLEAIDYRGDRVDRAFAPGIALGYRWWGDRPGKSPGIHRDGQHLVACAGTFAPPVPSPAAELARRLAPGPEGLDSLDGAFAAAWWDGAARRLTLVRDPFGVRSLYTVEHAGVLYFASELKQLLAVPDLPVRLDPVAIHKYLTFSFVPGQDVPVAGVRRVLPGHMLVCAAAGGPPPELRPYFQLTEALDPRLEDQKLAVRHIRMRCRQAIRRRLNGEKRAGVFLSGGIDSSGVTSWLKQEGLDVQAFTLDFDTASVEREQAEQVARALGVPLTLVPVTGGTIAPLLTDIVWKLDLPFGDPVTGPQYLLGRAARAAGLATVFSGEGGDQLFGGWTSKPMVAAQLYAGHFDDTTREEQYLKSYHRFYGLESELYTPDLAEAVGGPGQRRAHLAPYLGSDRARTFLNRVRLADIALKGSQNILPRAERMTNAWGLDARVPLFDRALAEASFHLPPAMKLRGACEKYVLKLVLQDKLPPEIVWRRKFGMSVPVTDWVMGPMAGTIEDLLCESSLRRRGLFRPGYVSQLRAGRLEPAETRRRRVGEKLWTLAVLEAWMRVFIDGRGARPGARQGTGTIPA